MAPLPNFAGTVSPAELLTKLDQQAMELNARKATADERLVNIERSALVAGLRTGITPATFPYSALSGAPAALTPKGLHVIGNANGNIRGDTDGKVAVCYLTPTRLAVTFAYSPNASFEAMCTNLYDINPDGSLTYRGYLPWGPKLSITGLTIHGAFAVADNVFRVCASVQSSSVVWMYLATFTVDPATNSLSVVVDVALNNPGWSGVGIGTGSQPRRRCFNVGSFGVLVPRPVAVYNQNNSVVAAAGAMLVERNAGSSYFLPRALQHIGSSMFCLDQIGDGMFAMLSDGFATGSTQSVELSLVHGSDATLGRTSVLRMGNLLSGNLRLKALSSTLLVGGYSSGAQYATYAWAYDPNAAPGTSRFRTVGALAINGALGVAPIEIVQLRPNRFAVLLKGANWQLFAHVYDVDPGAAAGTNPFSLVASFSVILGATITGATATDAVTVCAVEQSGPDRYAIVSRNDTRSMTIIETFDLS